MIMAWTNLYEEPKRSGGQGACMHAACVLKSCCCALHGVVFAILAQSLHHICPMGAAARQLTRCLCCAGGDLYEELKRSGGQMKEKRTSRDVLQPCLSALAYLHTKVCCSCMR